MPENTLTPGSRHEIAIEKMAHGGEGIGTISGRVVFVRGALPGDRCLVKIEQVKKRFARAVVLEVYQASPLRIPQRCSAAAHGAGCCDFGIVDPEAELGLKVDILRGQLSHLGGFSQLPPIESAALYPVVGWRTRVRLGVDDSGHAGVHRARSGGLVTYTPCAQVVPGLLDGIVGDGARRFSPGSQVIVARTDSGRQVIETRRSSRGRRTERVVDNVEGERYGAIAVRGDEFRVAATAFWQAHLAAPEAYSRLVERLCVPTGASTEATEPSIAEELAEPVQQAVAWDLYGGEGLFVPALNRALGGNAQVHTVDSSRAAHGAEHPALQGIDHRIHSLSVERAVRHLPRPNAVVLDPPRTGAGQEVITAVAAQRPGVVVHIGCDPATLARDLNHWRKNGYWVTLCQLIDAFPGTHHFEVVCQLMPADDVAHRPASGALAAR